MASSPNLASPTLAAAGKALRTFLRWWAAELASILPPRLRAWWQGHDRVILLSFEGTKAIFERQEREQISPVLSVDLSPADSRPPTDLAQKLALASGGNYRLLFRVPTDKVLRRQVTLPLAVEENLRQTLAFELDRLTPFSSDQAYFVYRVVERVPDQKLLIVELGTLAKSYLDSALARAEAIGIGVHGALMDGEILERGTLGIGLLSSPVDKTRISGSLRRWRLAAGALALCLFAISLVVPIWQKHAEILALNGPLAQAKAAAMEADAVRARLDSLVDRYNRIPNKKWESYSTVLILDELTRRLPDDTFVIQLDYDGKALQIQGETGSSGALIEILEASPMFKDVGFKSQLYKVQGTTIDRYHIEAALEAGAIPKPIPPALKSPADSPPATPEVGAVPPSSGASTNQAAPAPSVPAGSGVKR
jgi:general secretion pathway protein L